jgi:hypothetical protein
VEAGGNVLELVVYKLNPGVSREQFLETNPGAVAWISNQPGFISRDCVSDVKGDRWVDLVWWESIEHAETAAQRATTSESCAPMFALIDMDSMLMLHGQQAMATISAAPAGLEA